MMRVPLRLRWTLAPLRDAVAWFVPGPTPESWLAELTRWEIAGDELALWVVPCSRRELAPVGLLAVPPRGKTPQTSPRARPYGLVAGRVYLPVEARLEPELDDAELGGLLSSPTAVYVWHPSAGLVGFECDDVLRVSALASPPPERSTDWSRAQPGVTFSTRLFSVGPNAEPSPDSVIADARGDIGSQAAGLKDLPPHPGEPGPAGRAARQVWGWIASGLEGMGRMLSGGAAGGREPRDGAKGRAPAGTGSPAGGGEGVLGRWLRTWTAAARRSLEEARFKELQRLARLLESNPDEGLKFALPMTGGAPRGVAPPGGRLGARHVGFDLSRLGGGQPADVWDVPPDLQAQLRGQYLDLARRELHLGRHRRAAYIHAELLGDFASAASVLEAGRHFREAAVLYRERLNRPLEAARCLEQGGLLHEAIALYQAQALFEKEGELYRRLAEPEKAQRAYRRAVFQALERRDPLHAAQLLEKQLDAPDEALACLDEGWAADRQAAGCLAESFRLLARRGRHETARARIPDLRREPAGTARQLILLETLTDLAATYPDDLLRQSAADTTRVLVGARLASATSDQARPLLALVNRLVPADRLLTRDCQRFARRLVRPPPLPVRPSAPRSLHGRVRTVYRIALLPEVEWQTAGANAESWYVAGYEKAGPDFCRDIVLEHGFWRDSAAAQVPPEPLRPHSDVVRWRSLSLQARPLLLAVDARNSGEFAFRPIGGPALPQRIISESGPSRPRIVGTPVWLGDPAVAVAANEDSLRWTLQHGGDFRLTAHDSQRVPLQARLLPDDRDPETTLPEQAFPVPLAARGTSVFVGLGERVYAYEPHLTTPDGRTFDGPVRGISASPLYSRLRLAVSLLEGAVLIWDRLRGRAEPFAEGLPAPQTLFLRGGWIVAAGGRECLVYVVGNGRLQLHARCDVAADVFAVLPTANPHEFALATSDGALTVTKIEGC